MNNELIQKLIIAALGIVLLIVVLFFMVPALMRGEGNITIQTLPGNAKVIFDGKAYDSPAKLTNVRAGKHEVEVSKKGFKTRMDEVLVEKDKSTKITRRLYSSEASPTAVRANLDEVGAIKSDLEKLSQFLPVHNEKFRIEITISRRKPVVQITLYAILNKPGQYERFKEDSKAFGAEALKWIRSKDVDPDNLDIIWEPQDPNSF